MAAPVNTQAIHEGKFSPRNLIFHQFVKVFFLESFPLYGSCDSYVIVVCKPGGSGMSRDHFGLFAHTLFQPMLV